MIDSKDIFYLTGRPEVKFQTTCQRLSALRLNVHYLMKSRNAMKSKLAYASRT